MTRPDVLVGITKCIDIGCGVLYMTVNKDEQGSIKEVFVRHDRGSGCKVSLEALARIISITLRSGATVDHIIKQCRGLRCAPCMRVRYKALSCPDAIARFLEEQMTNKQEVRDVPT